MNTKLVKKVFALYLVFGVILNFSIILSFASTSKESYNLNSHSETYGNLLTSLQIGYEPELIAAVGNTGIEGYVRANELNEELPTTPDEALHHTNHIKPRVINLYRHDGVTIVGTFTIDVPTVSSYASDSVDLRSGYQYGDYGYGAGIGITFSNYSGIKPILRGVRGITGIGTTTAGTVFQAGDVGVKIRIIKKSNGKLVKESSYVYNEHSTTAFSATSDHGSILSTHYYNLGFTQIWNGSSFWTYNSFASPSVLPSLW